jgi:hypothetical protein
MTVGINALNSEHVFSLANTHDINVVEIIFNTFFRKADLKIYDTLGHLVYSEEVNNIPVGSRNQLFLN